MNEESPPKKKRRGPYKRYLLDPKHPVPRTTQWRKNKNATVSHSTAIRCSLTALENQHQEEQWNDSPEMGSDLGLSDGSDSQQTRGSDPQDQCISDSSPQHSDDSESQHSDNSLSDNDESELDEHNSSCEEEYEATNIPPSEMAQPMYPGSSVTVLGAYCILMEVKRLCRLPFSTMVILLEVLQLLCPAKNLLPTTKYQLIKFARKFSSTNSRIDFCRSCGKLLQRRHKCPQCQKTEVNSMILVSPDQALEQIISDNWNEVKANRCTQQGMIELVFNTDGVSPFKSSPLTIWPLFLSIANLPPHIRMLKQNIVTCIFWVAKSKPPLQLFFSHFKQILERINTSSLRVKTPEGIKRFYLKPIFGVFDLVAKAPILNMIQFNGKNGCPSCLHPGVRIRRTQTYPPGVDYELRTTESMKAAGTKADTDGVIIDGIKGTTILSSIVDLATGSPIDYMHCVLEGVVKRLLEKWVTSPGTPYYLNKNKISNIDSSFTLQRPPHDFSRAPRSIQKHRKFWKASEYRAWLLFYSLPLLVGFLPPLYIHHFALLVCSMHVLLQPNLSHTRIKAAEMMLNDFVILLPELYTEMECTLNSHLLLHLGQHARVWGPLWKFSAFCFEHKNGYLMGHVHSPHRVADQILFSLDLNHTLDSLLPNLLTSESERVLDFLSLTHTHLPGRVLLPGSYVVGSTRISFIGDEIKDEVRKVTGNCSTEVCEFNRVYHQRTIFHALKYGRLDSKRNSSICAFHNNGIEQYGTIDSFYIINSIPIAVIKPFSQSGSFLETIGVSGRDVLQKYASLDLLGAFIVQVNVERDQALPYIVVKLESIVCKCIEVSPTCSDFSYIIKLPNHYECH